MNRYMVLFVMLCLFSMPGAWAENGVLSSGRELTTQEMVKIDTVLDNKMADFDELVVMRLMTEYSSVDYVPYLIKYIEDEQHWVVARQRAMEWLASTKDPRGVPVFLAIINGFGPPPRNRLTGEQWDILYMAMIALGRTGDAKGHDLLVKMAWPEYWSDKLLDQERVLSLRQMALQGIAQSGSERAIAFFKRRCNIPEDLRKDLPDLRKLAKRKEKFCKNAHSVNQ